MPSEIRVWVARSEIRASIPRTVVREPPVIDHRRDSPERPLGNCELYDLALNVLNCFIEPLRGAEGEREPVKCFRGFCSAFAARHHCDFARDFLQDLREGRVIETAEIQRWIEHCRQTDTEDGRETEEPHLEMLSA
jgi:hypothetical protein